MGLKIIGIKVVHGLGIFSSKIELNKKIKEQEDKITQLEAEKDTNVKEIAELKEQIAKLTKENRAYENKYVHTNLDCEFCYTTLQAEFEYCPKCGKKIVKAKATETVRTSTNIFQTEVDGDYLLINQYNGFGDKKLVIPSSINGKTVIGIWNGVFENCAELEEVIFEEGCKYIGKRVFANCTKLKKVRLPKSLLEIGDSAFSGCAVEELAVPPNVKVIGSHAFSCRSLKKILLPENLKYISAGMMSYTSIEEISIPQSVVHIGYSAFSNSKLKEVELPHNLYSIEKYAFDIPSLSKITIHSNVKIISEDIFGMRGKAVKPTIYCSAGSKGLLYARKYGLNCSEIPAQPSVNVQVCSSSIILVLGSLTKGENIAEWYRYFGMNKAETWSWTAKYWNTLYIEKYMDMEDALRIRRAMKNFVNTHGDWSRPGIHCSLQELSVCEHWGSSAV